MTPTESDIKALLADGRAAIRCSCGFVVVGDDEAANRYALDDHPCPNRPVEYTPWYGYVFSLWGVIVLFIVASAVLAGIGAKW